MQLVHQPTVNGEQVLRQVRFHRDSRLSVGAQGERLARALLRLSVAVLTTDSSGLKTRAYDPMTTVSANLGASALFSSNNAEI